MVPADTVPASLSSLPESIGFSRGWLEISFASVEQLAPAMYTLARVLETEGDTFAQAYEPERQPEGPEDAAEIDARFGELEAMERERRLYQVSNEPGL